MTEENIKPLSCAELAKMRGREPTKKELIEDVFNQVITDVLNMNIGLPKTPRNDEEES
jgi:translation initiation factor IF-3